MKFNPDIHHRRSIRLSNYDYSQPGAYFVTVCAHNRECLFAEIIGGEMRLNEIGLVVDVCWHAIGGHSPNVLLDERIIMPNHLHGIILITNSVEGVGAKHVSSALPGISFDGDDAGRGITSPLHGTISGSLGAIIQNFKSVSNRKINKLRQKPGFPVWQRNYYERVIRDDVELARAREYIANNPLKWDMDRENSLMVR